jgi:hypothetical protein
VTLPDPCAICGRPAKVHHHLTGRDHLQAYLDPGLVVPVCHDHHQLLHDDLRDEQLDRVHEPLAVIERVAHRLRRVAVFFTRLAKTPMDLWAALAQTLRLWADRLTAAAGELGGST